MTHTSHKVWDIGNMTIPQIEGILNNLEDYTPLYRVLNSMFGKSEEKQPAIKKNTKSSMNDFAQACNMINQSF